MVPYVYRHVYCNTCVCVCCALNHWGTVVFVCSTYIQASIDRIFFFFFSALLIRLCVWSWSIDRPEALILKPSSTIHLYYSTIALALMCTCSCMYVCMYVCMCTYSTNDMPEQWSKKALKLYKIWSLDQRQHTSPGSISSPEYSLDTVLHCKVCSK